MNKTTEKLIEKRKKAAVKVKASTDALREAREYLDSIDREIYEDLKSSIEGRAELFDVIRLCDAIFESGHTIADIIDLISADTTAEKQDKPVTVKGQMTIDDDDLDVDNVKK